MCECECVCSGEWVAPDAAPVGIDERGREPIGIELDMIVSSFVCSIILYHTLGEKSRGF